MYIVILQWMASARLVLTTSRMLGRRSNKSAKRKLHLMMSDMTSENAQLMGLNTQSCACEINALRISSFNKAEML